MDHAIYFFRHWLTITHDYTDGPCPDESPEWQKGTTQLRETLCYGKLQRVDASASPSSYFRSVADAQWELAHTDGE